MDLIRSLYSRGTELYSNLNPLIKHSWDAIYWKGISCVYWFVNMTNKPHVVSGMNSGHPIAAPTLDFIISKIKSKFSKKDKGLEKKAN